MKLPDPVVAEIVNGELHASPRPAVRHAVAGSVLGSWLVPPFWHGRGGPGGWWLLDEPELHLGVDVVVPDLAGWRRSRLPRVPDEAFIALPPDWVCEILSPSTAALDRGKKLAVYARERVLHAWLLDPIARTLEALELREGRWSILDTHVGDAVVRVPPFTEVELALRLLWGED